MKNKHRHKTTGQHSFLGEENHLHKIDSIGDPLVKLEDRIDWELFRPLLNRSLTHNNKDGGRPSYDYVMMFKILILQRYTNLSDDQMEFQINDRSSYRRFLGLYSGDDVPDSRTIWHYKEEIRLRKLVLPLFRLFLSEMKRKGLIGNRGRIVDASFVDVPKQRNSREENLQVKNGQVPEEWKEKPNMLAQKDVEARWTKKNNEVHFGYKNNIKADTKSKMIMEYKTTSANVHDSQAVKDLLNKKDDKGCCFYADSAYIGHYINALVARIKMIARICKKGFRNRPLTEAQKRFNKLKSHVRVRVEHIFGFQTNSMDASCIRTIGIERADTVIGLNNLTYNMFRFLQIT